MEQAKKILCKLSDCVVAQLDKGVESVDVDEMSKAIDMIKDMAMTMYYTDITDAMKENTYGVDYNEKGRIKGYSDNRMMEKHRDIDDNMMYYTDNYSKGYSDGYYEGSRQSTDNSRYESAKKHYTETSLSSNDEMLKAKELEKMWKVVEDDFNSKLPTMTPEEKTMLKQKATNWLNTM